MALTIEGASLGFDANNVQSALNNLNTNVIAETISTMRKGYSDLQAAVDASWVGASAEQFKKNILTDIDNIAEALQNTYEVLESEFKQVQEEMQNADDELVKAREE